MKDLSGTAVEKVGPCRLFTFPRRISTSLMTQRWDRGIFGSEELPTVSGVASAALAADPEALAPVVAIFNWRRKKMSSCTTRDYIIIRKWDIEIKNTLQL